MVGVKVWGLGSSMATHSYHDGITEFGLADECERCSEHAQDPFRTLDDENIRMLVGLVVDYINGDTPWNPRSTNEAIAMRAVERVIQYAKRLDSLGIDYR